MPLISSGSSNKRNWYKGAASDRSRKQGNVSAAPRCGRLLRVFEARQQQARVDKNPRTGEKLGIPATTIPAFSTGKRLKQRVTTDS